MMVATAMADNAAWMSNVPAQAARRPRRNPSANRSNRNEGSTAMKVPPAPARSCKAAAAQSRASAGYAQSFCKVSGSTGWMLVKR